MYLLFDIGGTKTRIAVSKDEKNLDGDSITIVPTSDSYENDLKNILGITQKISENMQITKAAGSLGSPLDRAKTGVSSSYSHINKTLAAWAGKNLKNDLSEKLHCPVFLENDMTMIGLSEASLVEDYKNKIVVYITLSSGVNGTRITNGRVDKSAFGFEIGNQIIDPTQNLCKNCEKPGRFEDLVGGNYIEKRTGKKPQEIVDESFWEEITNFLVIALNNTIAHWSPHTIIIGGSIMEKLDIEKIKKATKKTVTIYHEIPEIIEAKLGDHAGLWGAIQYLNINK
ncbi:MAG: ROK family protein [Patescibacteria group bacterium]|nr:ROK family protein [Patescibacteria group bacterium]